MVGTVKKSMDTVVFTWFSRKVRHVCEGGFRRWTMYLLTLVSPISMPKLQEFAVDARSAPKRILSAHPPNQFTDFLRLRRAAALATENLPRPQQPKALAVPADHGLWLNDHKSRAPGHPELGQSCPEESICGGQLRSFDLALQDAELVAKSKDLTLKGRSGAEQRRKRREQCCENGGWRESTEDGQLPLYQPNRDFREPQTKRSRFAKL